MKKFLMAVVIIVSAFFIASHVFCEEKAESVGDDGYGYHMMGPCYGCIKGEYCMQRHGWGRRPSAWNSMKPEQREKLQKMQAAHMMDTLDLRMKLAAKRVELKTLWAQPEMDKEMIDKLSNEVAMLQAELLKKRNQHLLQCRQKFGDQGWDCPGGW
jgi:hypothetical protein